MRYLIIPLLILSFATASFADEPARVNSTSQDRQSLELTIYHENLALVKETRAISLPAGSGLLQYRDVASAILPTSVFVRPAQEDSRVSILEQNYEYDLISEDKLLDRYVGKSVKILKENEYHDRKEILPATLLSNNGQPIYEIQGEIYLGNPGMVILPELPQNLMATPTLVWQFTNPQPDKTPLQVSYLTRQMSWTADYILLLDEDEENGALAGWVSLTNESGTAYENAKLKLIAGDVHQVSPDAGIQQYMMAEAASFSKRAAPSFQEESFFEYHIYDLNRATTINNNQTKQIRLLEANHIALGKEYVVTAGADYVFTQPYGQENQSVPVSVFLYFQNNKENELAMPLPKGVVRIYKADHTSSLQFIGEDRLDHTPKDEEVKLKIGEAFDITAEKTQTDLRQITAHLFESDWEVVLKNHKETGVTVLLEETLPRNWEVLEHSHPYEKLSASKIRFEVPIEKDKEVKLTYRIRAGY